MPSPSTPSERSRLATMAVHQSWAQTSDRSARTAPARNAFLARFEAEVDPNGELSPEDRQQRAKSALSAYMQRLALASAAARSSQDREQARALTAEAQALLAASHDLRVAAEGILDDLAGAS